MAKSPRTDTQTSEWGFVLFALTQIKFAPSVEWSMATIQQELKLHLIRSEHAFCAELKDQDDKEKVSQMLLVPRAVKPGGLPLHCVCQVGSLQILCFLSCVL